jgi:cation:H+ antiporter
MFLLSFIIILSGCEIFTNGVEWTGRRFKLSEGAVGSVLAAVGTALPETIVPLIAILTVGGEAGKEIGVGAILGAPFMLATLALFVCGLSVLLFAKRRNTRTLHIDGSLIRRDLKFFLLAYSLAAIAALLPPEYGLFKVLVGVSLIPLYLAYTFYTMRSGECVSDQEELKSLYFHGVIRTCIDRFGRPQKCPEQGIEQNKAVEPSTLLIVIQVLFSLGLIVIGANLFVNQINDIATFIGINPLVLSLIVAPIATELPEKFNSLLWIRARKDTFAIGNITGAMVFQSCIPVTIGIALTDWHLGPSDNIGILQILAIGTAILSAIVLYAESSHKELKMSGLMFGGLLYILYIVAVLLLL